MGNYILGPNGGFISADELCHYGIKGMKWGVRRYQNKDGSLTPEGQMRVRKASAPFARATAKREGTYHRRKTQSRISEARDKEIEDYNDKIGNTYEAYIKKNPNFMDTFQKHRDRNFPNSSNETIDPHDYYQAHFHDRGTPPHIEKKYDDIFVRDYAKAVLKDLHLKSTANARAYAEEWVRKGFNKPVNNTNPSTNALDKQREKIANSAKLGSKYGEDIRSSIDKKSYRSTAEKREAINKAFRDKLREVKQTGDGALYDSVWQQWNFALDELE